MKQLTYPIVGMKFRPPALALTQTLAVGSRMILRREPTNKYDPNAIAVWADLHDLDSETAARMANVLKMQGHDGVAEEFIFASEWQVGYIPATITAWLAQNANVPTIDIEATFYIGSGSNVPHVRFELDVKSDRLPPQHIEVPKARRGFRQ